MRGLRGPREHLSSCCSLPENLEDYCSSANNNGNIEIRGDATLCFDESGKNFQGMIETKDGSHYAVYGSRSQQLRNSKRKISTPAGPPPSDISAKVDCQCLTYPNSSTPVAYDIRIVDSDVGDEYSIKRVHCKNGEDVSLSCKSVVFNTKETFRGQRADMMSQQILGHKMEGNRPVVYSGVISMEVSPKKAGRPWVL